MTDTSRYQNERYNPVLAHCHSLALRFDGRALHLTGGVARSYPAVSGRPSAPGRFDYSAIRQRQASGGPIPEGVYWVRPDELWSNAWYKPGSRAAWGNYRLTIHPFPTTQTYRRGGFFIHGGSVPGSAGCIDLTIHMDRFVADLRTVVGRRADCQIHLRVEYNSR